MDGFILISVWFAENRVCAGRGDLSSSDSLLDRNAKVRVMMVARALMRHQEKGKGLRQDQREGAGGAHRAALALPQRRDRQVLPRHRKR
jgi:hypothetical protein